jgi:hypothetical protein
MKLLAYILMTVAICTCALTQEPGSTSGGEAAAEQQKNAASASKDNSGISGDQITKPAGSKGSTLIGCLSGPNPEGKYALTSMQHRSGVEVVGPHDLKSDSGSKVKLTGAWEANPEQQVQAKGKEMRRFQVTAVEVLSPHCKVPSETTPVSKEKQRQRQDQEQQQQKPPQ